jgi:hypothetical protein
MKNTDIHTPGGIQTYDLIAKAASTMLYRLFSPRLPYMSGEHELWWLRASSL